MNTKSHLERLTAAGVEWRLFTGQHLDSCGLFRDAVHRSLPPSTSKSKSAFVEVSAPQQRSPGFGGKATQIISGGNGKCLSSRAIAAKVHASAMTVLRIIQREQRA